MIRSTCRKWHASARWAARLSKATWPSWKTCCCISASQCSTAGPSGFLVAHDKFFYFDAGVCRSIRPKGPLDQPESNEDMALEGLVA